VDALDADCTGFEPVWQGETKVGMTTSGGYLRGWMKTDANGKYEFETIRPAAYDTHDPGPAHIHYTIQHAEYPEYWLTGLWFSDDPRIASYLDKVERDGGFSNITTLTKDDNNILKGTRNIILQKFAD